MTVAAPVKTETIKPSKQDKKAARRRFSTKIGQIVLWQAVALLFAEGIMYTAGLGEEEIFRLDKEIGFKHIPNKRIYWKQEGPGVYSHFDSDGMREPNLQIAKPAGTYRIAVLGDSLVEGLQSPIEKTFGYRIGENLSKKLNRPIEVLNFGNSGYSTAQEYLQLKKVWKYSPDLVLLGYSNRDIFENWSPPDETISNVRPYALHLPNSHLVVDNSSVTNWMRTPRAKFLLAIAPLREYSHIWGMISAAETQFGHTDPLYKAISEFLTNPVKSVRQMWAGLPAFIASLPQATVKSLQSLTVQPIEHLPPSARPPVEPKAPAVVQVKPEAQQVANKQRDVFITLLNRTLGSLLAEMKKESASHGAKFCLITMPSRSELCPEPNAPADGFGLTYPQEVDLVKKLCSENDIPMHDADADMARLDQLGRRCQFYTNHLTPLGHYTVSVDVQPFIEKQIESQPKP